MNSKTDIPKPKKNRKNTGKRIIVFLTLFICLCSVFFIWQNNDITVSATEYANSKIPPNFNGYKIVQISDLHNKKFGRNQHRLINHIKELQPDIILITGDIIDRRHYNLDTALEFTSQAAQIAPTYYVTGNHEAWSGKYGIIKSELEKTGVITVDNKTFQLKKNGQKIRLIGTEDPAFYYEDYLDGADTKAMEEHLDNFADEDSFKILLAHRPNFMYLYKNKNIDLVFTGHAHGGQIRLPFIGAFYVPDQGFNPQYTIGCYTENNTTMYVSRGLGNSVFPFRIFNRPEIVAVTLISK